MRYVLSESRLKAERGDFLKSISHASKDTQARYLREYDRYARTHARAPTKAVAAPAPPVQAPRPSAPVKRSAGGKRAPARYVLSEARFKEGYDTFKARMAELPKTTQERYWRDWNRYHVAQSILLAPKARARFLHVFRVYAVDNAGRPIMYYDDDGNPQPFYFKKYVDDKRHLDRDDLDFVKLSVNEETNVNVSKVEVVMTCDVFVTTRYH